MDARKAIPVIAMGFLPLSISAAPELAVSGFMDISAHYNFNNPAGGTSTLRSYDSKADSFYLNAVHGVFSAAPVDGVTAVVELDGGTDAAINKLKPAPEMDLDVQEAYVSYTHEGTGLGFKAGKMATFMGIEVIEAPDNPTITRGFLFGLAECFTHTGVFATYKKDAIDAALGVVNGWDVVVDNNTGKSGCGKFSYSPGDAYGVTASFMIGPEQADDNHDIRRAVDVTGFVGIGEGHRVNLQAIGGDDKIAALSAGRVGWYGFGVQPVFALTDAISLGARVEWFNDPDGARTAAAGGTSVTNFTVAPAWKITEKLTVRAEARLDLSSEKAFETSNGNATDHQATMSGEVYYRF